MANLSVRMRLIKWLAGRRPVMLNMTVHMGKRLMVVSRTPNEDAVVSPTNETDDGIISRCVFNGPTA